MFGSLGGTELIFIFVIALIIFGPRKLPELGKTLGQTLGQFKRASEDFRRSWEREVEIEKRNMAEATAPAPKLVPSRYSRANEPEPASTETAEATPEQQQ
jgi:TatA/E family protein of Tat protein translocase